MENEVSPENWNIFHKMKSDHWGNVVMLTNGLWFIAGHIYDEYQKGSQTWIEFGEINFNSADEVLDERKNISRLYVRRLAVPVSSIAFIGEQDS